MDRVGIYRKKLTVDFVVQQRVTNVDTAMSFRGAYSILNPGGGAGSSVTDIICPP